MKDSIKKNKWIMELYYAMRFHIHGNKKSIKGSGNTISIGNALLQNTVFDIVGNDNKIVFGESVAFKNCNITIRGNAHTLDIGNYTSFYKSNIAFEDEHCCIVIGERTSMQAGGEIAAVEPGSRIDIGKDCMFSTHVDIRNTDSHSIIDNETNQRINPGKNIHIEDHVWIGAHVQVLKGVTIGKDSVIGIRSLVTKAIPSSCVAVGVPAKVIKTNVRWSEERI